MPKKPSIPDNPILQDACDAYLKSIERDGRTSGTAASYKNDLRVALKYLGAETPLRDLTADRVREFFDAAVVTTKRNGTPKNPISIAKTRRILRLALVWAQDSKWLDVAPIPPKAAIETTADETPVVEVPATEPAPPPATDAEPVIDLPGFDHPTMIDVTPEEVEAKKSRRAKKAKTATAE